jgi:MFS family permease
MKVAKHILPVIVIAQFCCTSLWFASNCVMNELAAAFQFESSALSDLTSAVQFGFIAGTLVFALLTIADRFSPSLVFLLSALAGAALNLCTILEGNTLMSLLFLRFGMGFFLAGIYPVGMKIASDYFDKGLGKSLGFLVGALVVGTALPHLIKGSFEELPWRIILISISILATFGGALIYFFVPNGPYRKSGQKTELTAIFTVFKNRKFRAAAFGYFGHMWELYAFWAFVPVMLAYYLNLHPDESFNVSQLSFIIIGIGGISCAVGGYISAHLGTRKTAAIALFLSGLSCFLSPFFFFQNSTLIFLLFMIFWGIMVVADSPLFSTLVAQNAPAEARGTALTIVNCLGFAITIFSIQLVAYLGENWNFEYAYVILGIGAVFGLLGLFSTSFEEV